MRPHAALTAALKRGDPEEVARLIAAGADVRYRDENGYDAMIDAVHGRALDRDGRLLEILQMLLTAGVDPSGVSSYGESALRVLSRVGRFDAVRVLLDAGANQEQLVWTPLIRAVALGSLAEVEERIKEGAALEEIDWWSRTAWLVALAAGDLDKAKLLLAAGGDAEARGRCAAPPLFYGIQGNHAEIVRWLLDLGQDVDGADEFGHTPLMKAVEEDAVACVQVLLEAGADLRRGTILEGVQSRAMALRLLDAGADPRGLQHEGRRLVLGYPFDPDPSLMTASSGDFYRAPKRVFGQANPERVDEPFWEAMIRSGISAYEAAKLFSPAGPLPRPVWCARRFGQSLTFLPDGRIIEIGGEHEDWSDPDFCIYNDVFVHGTDGSVAIFGYPAEIFPPTDFHTATLIGGHVYVIGSLGYRGARRFGETPIYRLDVASMRIDRLEATGEKPGWIHDHRATLLSAREIQISGGRVSALIAGDEALLLNRDTFVLDVERLQWRREPTAL